MELARSSGDVNEPQPLSEGVRGIVRHVPTITIVAVLVTGAVMAFSLAQPARYTSTASVVLGSSEDSTSTNAPNMATEKEIASSIPMAAAVIRDLHLNALPQDVLNGLSVTVPVDTEVLVFSYTSTEPQEAQARAQAFVDAYLAYRHQRLLQSAEASDELIRSRLDELRRQLRTATEKAAAVSDPGKRAAFQVSENALLAQIGAEEQQLASAARDVAATGGELTPASLPTSPSQPRLVVNSILGLFLGCVLGTFAALARAALAPRAYSAHEIERAVGVPVLVDLPRPRTRGKASPIVATKTGSEAATSYRRLTSRLLAMRKSTRKGARTGLPLAVVGLDPRTETGDVVANLGVAMALSGMTVLLASTKPGRTALDAIFGVSPRPGLSDVVRGELPLADAIQPTNFESLTILPAGSDQDGWAFFRTDRVHQVTDEMGAHSDIVIVDVPGRASDEANIMISSCKTVLLIGTYRSTSLEDARLARDELESLGVTRMGIVMFEGRPRFQYLPRGKVAALTMASLRRGVTVGGVARRAIRRVVPNGR